MIHPHAIAVLISVYVAPAVWLVRRCIMKWFD